jgi:L-serine dehydratase
MISVFELFKIGIGPSSSHTVGPMKAAASFARGVADDPSLERVEVTLYGSLAWTGRGHATDRAVVLGLAGELPETVDPERAEMVTEQARRGVGLPLGGHRMIAFDWLRDIQFDLVTVPARHPNTLSFRAIGPSGRVLAEETWLSVGGGFVVREDEADQPASGRAAVPHEFRNAAELLQACERAGLTIADLVRANEVALHGADALSTHLGRVIDAMLTCIDRGLAREGELPGGLRVRRRAPGIYRQLEQARLANARPAHEIMDFIGVFAIAVNEENAAGGRVVTAPTNGAAGVVPAVLRYYRDFCEDADRAGMETFLLAATAVGALFKMNASISGAEVGCQGEVGVACSMAAAGLAAALGGTNAQVENAAEIGMEHHLGMTCDPIGGLVQIPCIERNAFGAVKAVTAASLSLRGDGTHKVSLDQVIATMRQTGLDMHNKYKETSQGGLAVNWVEC